MTYPDSVQFLYALGNEMKTAKLGLQRIMQLLASLGHPERAFRVVHVAGTNGKGSVCAMIDSGLRAAGVRTGLFISPHLIEPTERIQIDGMPVSQAQFSKAFDVVHAAAAALPFEHPSYFETITAMAFWLFREAAIETAVVEVGLGGRLDCTNVVQPVLTVITSVDMDHEAWLGDTIQLIAAEKAGILKPGVPAVVSAQRRDVQVVLDARAKELGVRVLRADDFRATGIECDARGGRFSGSGLSGLRVPLPGEHQIGNAITAVMALRELAVPDAAIEEGLATTRWPGRLEYISPNPDVLLDGAHNPAGAQALARYLEKHCRPRKIWMIFAAMRDKAAEQVGSILFPLADELILTAPALARAMTPQELAELAGKLQFPNARTAANPIDALQLAAEGASQDDVIVATGSLYLVGEVRAASYNKNSWPFTGLYSR